MGTDKNAVKRAVGEWITAQLIAIQSRTGKLISVAQLAEQLGIPASTLSRLQRGKNIPDVATLEVLDSLGPDASGRTIYDVIKNSRGGHGEAKSPPDTLEARIIRLLLSDYAVPDYMRAEFERALMMSPSERRELRKRILDVVTETVANTKTQPSHDEPDEPPREKSLDPRREPGL